MQPRYSRHTRSRHRTTMCEALGERSQTGFSLDRSNMWTRSGTIELQAGRKYDLQLEYAVFGAGLSYISLSWSTPSQPEEIIPPPSSIRTTGRVEPAIQLPPHRPVRNLATPENTALPILLQATDPRISRSPMLSSPSRARHALGDGAEPDLHPGCGLQRPGQLHVQGQRRGAGLERRDGPITVTPVNGRPWLRRSL